MITPVIVFAIVVLATWLARHEIGSPMLARFRALVPAWRFFEQVTPTPVLLVRFADRDAPLTEWLPVIALPPRRWIVAPAANLALAYHSLIETLVTGGDDAPGFDVTCALVTELARSRVPASLHGKTGARLQWCVRDHDGTELARSQEIPA